MAPLECIIALSTAHSSSVGWGDLGMELEEVWGPLACLGIICNRKEVLTLIFSLGVPFPHPHPLLGGRGESGEGKAAEMSHQERERETEMRRDTERQLLGRQREENTRHKGGIHKLTRERKLCTSLILNQSSPTSTCHTHTALSLRVTLIF